MQQPAPKGAESAMSVLSSFIRTMTVGSGISPDLLTPSRCNTGSGARGLPESHRDTAGGEFHPALRISADSLKKSAGRYQPKTGSS